MPLGISRGAYGKVTIRLTEEMIEMISKRATEENEGIGTFLRTRLIEPWYLHQIGLCSSVTVYFKGEVEIAGVEVAHVPSGS